MSFSPDGGGLVDRARERSSHVRSHAFYFQCWWTRKKLRCLKGTFFEDGSVLLRY